MQVKINGKKVNLKDVVARIQRVEKNLKARLESGELQKQVKSFTKTQAKALRAKVENSRDLQRAISMVDARKKQVERMAKALPKEVQMVRSYIMNQRSELKKLGDRLVKTMNEAGKASKAKKAPAARRTTKKKATTKKAR
ncbi:MAG: hypothetical protein HUU37_09095 [Bdellovibrionales bacterium]|nr:hypothetical protein [Bdellovibrionales bacterium]